MPDIFTREKRSDVMSRIRAKNTKPELRIRKALHALGYRFRLHRHNLPGRPDLVLPKYDTVVQIRGCFWHGHTCRDGHYPKSRRAYWIPKLKATRASDRRNDRRLRAAGWSVIVVWECRCKDDSKLEREVQRIVRLLNCRV